MNYENARKYFEKFLNQNFDINNEKICHKRNHTYNVVENAKYLCKCLNLDEINTQLIIKEKEIDELKKQFSVYKAKMESLLISQLELLKDMNGEE